MLCLLLAVLKSEGNIEVLRFGILFAVGLVLIFVLPFFINYSWKFFRFKKIYAESEGKIEKDSCFSFEEQAFGRGMHRYSLYVDKGAKRYSSPYIFYAQDVSEIMHKTLVFILDSETMYPLWTENNNETE